VASAYYLAAQNRPLFFVAVFIVAILSGATATVVGFGIGSLMRPLLAIKFGRVDVLETRASDHRR
jgi:uncharacterized membrane protein YfcA